MQRLLFYIVFFGAVIGFFAACATSRQTPEEREAKSIAVKNMLEKGEFRFIPNYTRNPQLQVLITTDNVGVNIGRIFENVYVSVSSGIVKIGNRVITNFEYSVIPGRRAETWIVQIFNPQDDIYHIFEVREDGIAFFRLERRTAAIGLPRTGSGDQGRIEALE